MTLTFSIVFAHYMYVCEYVSGFNERLSRNIEYNYQENRHRIMLYIDSFTSYYLSTFYDDICKQIDSNITHNRDLFSEQIGHPEAQVQTA